ncbi:CLUMA_CG016219, isoform A [Clunio marinus]|uniref:CLUMA_CG016219, isoform A n=1 Tax=Clunio marinus TaxID=568069 RepID=A0A1J1ISP0_9DIPT|nr:CLUMA_CG016219, isoform A [Clunio marinus]
MVHAEEIVKITQNLIDVINRGDYGSYEEICDHEMSAIEPESFGQIVIGYPFHKFYFDNALNHSSINNTMVNPSVHILGEDAACIAYVRLTQYLDKHNQTHTHQSEETRVWQRKDDKWRCIHLHRSYIGNQGSMTPFEGK